MNTNPIIPFKDIDKSSIKFSMKLPNNNRCIPLNLLYQVMQRFYIDVLKTNLEPSSTDCMVIVLFLFSKLIGESSTSLTFSSLIVLTTGMQRLRTET